MYLQNYRYMSFDSLSVKILSKIRIIKKIMLLDYKTVYFDVFKNLQDINLENSDDQIQFKSHRLVISACSQILKTHLLDNPNSQPMIFNL